MRFPHLPVTSAQDTTRNFEQLQGQLNTVAIAFRSTAQKIPHAVETRVRVDKAISDPGGNFDLVNGLYLARTAGYYLVAGETNIELTKGFNLATIQVNGIERARGTEMNMATETISGQVVTGLVLCAPGDKVELVVYQEKGVGTEAVLSLGEAFNRLSVIKVA